MGMSPVQKPTTRPIRGGGDEPAGLADTCARRAPLAARQHANRQVLAMREATHNNPCDVEDHHRQHRIGDALVQFTQPIAAVGERGKSGERGRCRKDQQRVDGEAASRIMADVMLRPR